MLDQITRYQLKRKRDLNLQKLEQQEKAGADGKTAERKDESDGEASEWLIF